MTKEFYKKTEIPDYPENWSSIIRRIKRRDGYCCQECGKQYSPHSRYLRVHHKIPISKGGKSHGKNLVTLCWLCHTKKHPHLQMLLEKRGNKAKFFKSNWRKRVSKKHNYKSKVMR